jgi:DNA-binding NtrC family response regulator
MQANAGEVNVPRLGGTVMSPEVSSQAANAALAPPSAEMRGPGFGMQSDAGGVGPAASTTAGGMTFRPLRDIVAEAEKEYILRALEAAGGNKSRAAELLSVSRKTLWERMREHGISPG